MIDPTGYNDSERYCGDGRTVFGRSCASNKNKLDIFFDENDTRISGTHF